MELATDLEIDGHARAREAGLEDGDLFKPLGRDRSGSFWFFSRSAGCPLRFSARDLSRLGAALAIYPDLDHWRWVAPGRATKGAQHADWAAIGADLIARCNAVVSERGFYDPPREVRPLRGRPRKTVSTG
jgi:hypothetical protein